MVSELQGVAGAAGPRHVGHTEPCGGGARVGARLVGWQAQLALLWDCTAWARRKRPAQRCSCKGKGEASFAADLLL